jgi:hypothetical protein
MAKSRVKPVDDPETPADESLEYVEPLVDGDGDEVTADTHICLEGSYIKHDHAKDPRPRTVNHGGRNYEHTHEDGLGVWCYRHM